ncbi:MAG: hypothetical protein HLUCCA11_13900 [Phormidesmis priestleyi Ana]|uniref:Uncharacterized protein n=1 Tax=Phormidesmis priestleyi Ana TaxID=1666911 RepID=A0A0N8KMT1_9CYAN|nr:MAG: hypothetical protein HLUCCA11_13900 [Phormidesmis priestleyi Ana]
MGIFGWGKGDSTKPEDEMDDDDRMARAGEQARASIFGGDPFLSSPDASGEATGGDYNGDYPDSWHETLNKRIDDEPDYANEVREDLQTLARADLNRREVEDSL